MTRPGRVNTPNVEPGRSEFSHGRGLVAPKNKDYSNQYTPTDVDELTPYEQMKAIQNTDSTNPDAQADLTAPPRTANNYTETQWIRER